MCYLTPFIIILESLSKYKCELLIGVSSACQWSLYTDLLNEEYLELDLHLLLPHLGNL